MDKKELNPTALAAEVEKGNRRALARAITLVESANPNHRNQATELLGACLLYTSPSPRDA